MRTTVVCRRAWCRTACAVGAVAILSSALIGCGGTYRSKELHRPPLEETERVVYKNWDLKASVGIMDVSEDYVNGLLRARVKVKNLVKKLINAEIKVKFRDSDGYEIGDPAPWYPFPLESGEIRTYEQVATSKDAVDFRIVIQRAEG